MKALYTTDNGDITISVRSDELHDKQLECLISTVTSTGRKYFSLLRMIILDQNRCTDFAGLNCEWDYIPHTEQQAPIQITVTPDFVEILGKEKLQMIRMGNELIHMTLDNQDMERTLATYEHIV